MGELEAQGSKANTNNRLSLAFLALQAVWLTLLTHLVEYFPFSPPCVLVTLSENLTEGWVSLRSSFVL